MQFASRLILFHKAQNLTHQGLADAAQIHVNQINAQLDGMIIKYQTRQIVSNLSR